MGDGQESPSMRVNSRPWERLEEGAWMEADDGSLAPQLSLELHATTTTTTTTRQSCCPGVVR